MASQDLIASLKRSDQEREERTQETARARKEAMIEAGVDMEEIPKDSPRFYNLNEDSQLSNVLAYPFIEQETMIGRTKGMNDHIISGMFIQARHAIVYNENGQISIEPVDSAKVFVNGVQIYLKTKLKQGDRVLLGNHHFFRFYNPQEPSLAHDVESSIDWEFAQTEIEQEQGRIIEQSMKGREQEMEENFNSRIEQMQQENEIEKMKQVKKIQQLEELNKARIEELERAKYEIAELKRQSISVPIDQSVIMTSPSNDLPIKEKTFGRKVMDVFQGIFGQPLDNKMNALLPLVREANCMAREMGKSVRYESKLFMNGDGVTEWRVQIKDRSTQRSEIISMRDFMNKKIPTLRQRYDAFKNHNVSSKVIFL
jgi:kinesin family protein 13